MSDFTPRQIKLTVTRRWYQENFIAHRNHHLLNDEIRQRILYSSPTGSGKSFMFLDALGSDPFAWGITNRLEIVADMLRKCGEQVDSLSTNALVELAWEYRISTPIRYRNTLKNGTVPFLPWRLYIDEVHHSLADTFKDIYAFLPAVSIAGLTATPFRGTPKGTHEFMQQWDRVVTILDIPTAAEQGIMTIPEITIWPLVDDDEIEVTNGEFSSTSAGDVGLLRSQDLCNRIHAAGWVQPGSFSLAFAVNDSEVNSMSFTTNRTVWDKPTIFAVSTREQAYGLRQQCELSAIPAVVITQETSREDRQKYFKLCIDCTVAIIQIDVVSEGVDLPIRRIIDMRPTFSPVRWLQLVGRSTRPRKLLRYADTGNQTPIYETHSEYICCNRNLERHAHLMCGMLPASKIAEAQTVFGSLSQRSQTMRAVGTEGLGRLKPINIKFTDGTTGSVYNLYYMDGYVKKELAVLLHPNKEVPVIASRENVKKEDGTYAYGNWREIASIPDVTGYASASGGVITEKQAASWCKHAASYGLDASVIPNRKNIQAYYLLRDLRCYKMRGR